MFEQDHRPHDPLLAITRRREYAGVVVRVEGEVDVSSAPALQAQLGSALARSPGRLVVDLREVRFFGAVGIDVLLDCRRRCLERSVPLRVLAGRVVNRTLGLCQVDGMPVIDVTTSCPSA
ncbi:STAS domain-containing protein [Prauserella cavernicola]|uniref:STAS domain-containing protein n=1 Tax=Prauserella cavernicola TaxID=2800127 RepID=A0A934V352_9PSEU|nr:STAS domain-containing protein [Prauserella cavernicola]MBK1783927.1 STAS domain-containing protein [Prauserella cavernicola]